MKGTQAICSLLLAAMLMLPSLLQAEEGTIQVQSRAEMEVIRTNEKGEKNKVLIPAERVIPGETVIYTNTLTNLGKDTAEALTINNPVPEHTEYVAGSAFGDAAVTFSADGGKTFAPDGQVTVIGEDGKPRPALPREYTHIRWSMNNPLPPGTSTEAGFRVRLQ